jgi:hypothetical protein
LCAAGEPQQSAGSRRSGAGRWGPVPESPRAIATVPAVGCISVADHFDQAGTGVGGAWVAVPAEERGPSGCGVDSGSLPPWSSRNGG